MEFIDWELNNTEKRAAAKLKEAKTIEDATLTFSKYYERPHKDYAHNDKRISYAKSLGEQLKIDPVSLNTGKRDVNEVVVDNTAVRKPRIPSIATPPLSPNYAALPETQKEKNKEPENSKEIQIRKILEAEKQAMEEKFVSAFKQQNSIEEEYIPRPQQEDLSYLYNYIKLQD